MLNCISQKRNIEVLSFRLWLHLELESLQTYEVIWVEWTPNPVWPLSLYEDGHVKTDALGNIAWMTLAQQKSSKDWQPAEAGGGRGSVLP